MVVEYLSRTERLDRDWEEWIKQRGTVVKVWNTLKTTYKVSDFIGWQRDSSLILNPNFQRRSVWKSGAKSYLIDTIIRGFPIPIIFLRDKTTDLKTFSPMRDVVDGQQRLRTVIAFIAPHLLTDFDPSRDVFRISKSHNDIYKGKSFKELPEKIQSQILDYQFTVNVFPSDTDDREVKQVFARMNSSGYKLNPQELRNAEFYGEFKSRAYDLATEQLNRWRDWGLFDANDLARMDEVELTSELMILIISGVSEKNDKVIDGYYRNYDDDFKNGAEVAKRLRIIFDTIDSAFSDAMKLLFDKRTMFYALFAAVYDLKFGIASPLALKNVQPNTLEPEQIDQIKQAASRIMLKNAPRAVLDAKTRRTTHVKERKIIIEYLLKLT